MAYTSQTSLSMSWQAGADLSNNQFTFVSMDSTSQIQPCAKTSQALGVLANQPSAGVQGQYAATVDLAGVTRICVAGVYPVGTVLVPGTDGSIVGLGYSVADATSNFKYARAITLQASTAAYDVVAARLIDNNPGVDSTTA